MRLQCVVCLEVLGNRPKRQTEAAGTRSRRMSDEAGEELHLESDVYHTVLSVSDVRRDDAVPASRELRESGNEVQLREVRTFYAILST